jgi:hypothetical protein
MKLHPQWAAILQRAWSVRLAILSAVLIGADQVVQSLIGAGYVTVSLAILSGFTAIGAALARICLQPKSLPNG